MIELRPYQRAGVDALFEHWRQGGGNGLLVYPTGAGKSLVLASIIKELLERWPTMRIAVVTHVKELILQDYQELKRLWPSAPAGIYSAGLGKRDTYSRVIFCGIQSVWNKTDALGDIDLLLVDEAHLIPRNSDTTYGKFIERLQARVPDMRIAGLTATPYRLDSGRLDDGGDALFDTIIYEVSVSQLIEEGYLAPLISKRGATEIDVTGIGKRGGDFIASALEAAADDEEVVRAAVAELVSYGKDRRAWIVFCAGVKHALHVRDEIRAHGYTCEAVTGDMDNGERDRIIRMFREGQIRCLTSVGVLTTGFNVPHVDLIGLMRPTLSTGLYVQQVGRGFRKAPGKDNCLVLDWAGVVRRHGPVDMVEVAPRRKGSANPDDKVTVDTVRAKTCPGCEHEVALNARTCWICGHEWPISDKPQHAAEADDVPILSTEAGVLTTVVDHPVASWSARRWVKDGAPDSVRVTYMAGLQAFNEWVCPEHTQRPRYRFEKWWTEHGGADPVPATVAEALVRFGTLRQPDIIQTRRSGKWFDIVGRRFAPIQQGEAA